MPHLWASREALLATATHGAVAIVPLSTAIGNLIELRANTYAAYRSRLGPDGQHLPSDFQTVVRGVAIFADALADAAGTSMHWDPTARRWDD